jgi:hypothetical protein
MKDQVDPDTGEVTPEPKLTTPDDAPDFDPELSTLAGDLRDWLLGGIRTLQKPWQQMSEQEQVDTANAADLGARDVIRRMVRIMARHAFQHTVVELGEVKIGGTKGIEAKITCPNIEHNRTVLGENVGQQVQIVMVNSDIFMGSRADVEIDKDQPALDLDSGGVEAEDVDAEAAPQVGTKPDIGDTE